MYPPRSIRRFLLAAAAPVLAVALLAGCGGGAAETTNDADPVTESNSEQIDTQGSGDSADSSDATRVCEALTAVDPDTVFAELTFGEPEPSSYQVRCKLPVTNAEYLRYFEQSRVQWLETLGYQTTGKGCGPILATMKVTYLKPVVYPSELEVRLLPARVGNTSFTLASEIVNGRDAAERFTEGEFVIVWLDYEAGKPVPVPDRLRAALAGAP